MKACNENAGRARGYLMFLVFLVFVSYVWVLRSERIYITYCSSAPVDCGEKLEQQAVIKAFSGLRPTGVGVKNRSLTGLSVVSHS